MGHRIPGKVTLNVVVYDNTFTGRVTVTTGVQTV